MKLSNTTYDILKYVALIGFPAVAYLVGQVGEIWGFNNAVEIVLTINALSTALGILLQVSTNKYNKEQ